MYPFRQNILIVFSIMVSGMLVVGLYPFDYFPPNRVSWTEGGMGLRFDGPGLALVKGDYGWPGPDYYSGKPITIEAVLRPARYYSDEIPHILTLCDQSGHEVSYFAQWEDSLLIRLVGSTWGIERVKREVDAGRVLVKDEKVLITVVLRDQDAAVYANGRLDSEYRDVDLLPHADHRTVRSVIFGNSSTGDNYWEGNLLDFSVSIGQADRGAVRKRYEEWAQSGGELEKTGREVIRYRFREGPDRVIPNQVDDRWDLYVPRFLTPPIKRFLTLPNKEFIEEGAFYQDIVINLAGFIPFGLVLMLMLTTWGNNRPRHPLILSVFGGAALSLFIETNQVFLVSRTSSLTDLALNILGAAIGALMIWILQMLIDLKTSLSVSKPHHDGSK